MGFFGSKPPPKRGLVVALIVLIVASPMLMPAMFIPAATASAADVGTVYSGVYPGPNWYGPDDANGYQAIDRVVVPQLLVPRFFWSTAWYFVGKTYGAYAGIQTDGDLPGGAVGDMALFSVWHAIAAVPGPGSQCVQFDNEDVGWSCRAPLPVVAGHRYATHVAIDHIDGANQWWHGTITDMTAGITVDLGLIEADTQQPMTAPADFMEYFGDKSSISCDQYPFAIGDFVTPVLTPASGGSATPATLAEPGAAFCGERSNWTVMDDGVRVEFGGPQPSPITNFTAGRTGATANLSWTNPISDGGSPVLDTIVETSTNGGTIWSNAATVPADQTSATLSALKANTDSVRVAAVNSNGVGAYSSVVALPPLNDAFASSRALVGDSGRIRGTNLAATREAGDPNPGGVPSGHSLWYRFTPATNGTLSLGACGSDFDTVMAVYKGASIGALTSVASNDDSCGIQSQLSAALTSGVAYRILLTGKGGAAGISRLDWQFVGVPTAPRTPSAVPGASLASLTWAAPLSQGGSAITGYVVTPYVGGIARPAHVFNTTATTQNISGLGNATTYTFEIAAKNAGGTGPLSVATAPITVGAPKAPTVVDAARVAAGQLRVTFTAGADNGAAVTTFTARCASPDGGATKTKSGAAGPLTVTALSAGKTYSCTVNATNSRGTGPSSSGSPAVTA